ncbi:hypothetical protein C343_00454 [Cryptococcus neoformans C23]|uniref:HMG box domain-containing protein n=1 Tax=Cryptococcus neoformans (strain H99 / ATCC 208821 / CBS 10515 / FGSC 9487) TaxID=235443 RepID=J9VE45_CRYN9|nr:hypothetical protein CNAG_00445 [Cryptococcus neoformans var. grubii H99]AFR92577.2 hypothetical protein CNAG_00445 [Cryptococcus neoformans var. grubii H99]AUB22021.1 hypothetical protein CKF44_00445 [Cryptococcus neoformans var. grubii]OWZ48031.1 hypothetical protein C343_00454 [Cryptococcus neoformans var. grubii C23]|eukprot:XP_012046316.1 hypothetical protein CNAG_00445 [Cryptococcus neoformans var. grubii H99]
MMQSTNAPVNGGVSQQWQSAMQSMYSGAQQRPTSNPKPYNTSDANGMPAKKDDANQSLYSVNTENGYPAYQQQGYGTLGGLGQYGYNSTGLGGLSAAYVGATSSTAGATNGRRTSGQRMMTPPSHPSSVATNTSPSARYYTGQEGEAGRHASPYQPASAPPQILSHQFNTMTNSPQTAQGYPQYQYNQQSHQQNPTQWGGYSTYGQSQNQARNNMSGRLGTTSAIPQNSALGDSSARQQPTSMYDYTTHALQQWPASELSKVPSAHQSSWQNTQSLSRLTQAQSPALGQTQPPSISQPTTSTSSTQNASPAVPQGGWQGYSSIPNIPPHTLGGGHLMSGQPYGWGHIQQWGGYYGAQQPPQAPQGIPAHRPPLNNFPAASTSSAPAESLPTGRKRMSKDKGKPAKEKEEDRSHFEDYHGLGKRSAEAAAEELPNEDKKESKKKKGKEEKEKPVPKAKSHLHPPKQAPSSWQLFFADELAKAKAAEPESRSPGGTSHPQKLNVAQIAKEAGVAYANLSEERKKYYAERVKEHREIYAKELAAWQATLTPEDIRAENAFRAQQRKEGKSRKGNIKDPNAPKKPLSAYFLFLKAIRENSDIRAQVWGTEAETTKQSVMAAEKWRSLTDDEKRPYLEQAEHDKQTYETARKQYEEDSAARARGEDVPIRAVEAPASPPKPPASILRSIHGGQASATKSSPSVAESVPHPAPHSDLEPSITSLGKSSSPNPASEPTLAQFHTSPRSIPHYDASLEVDDFRGFSDPLNMDLSGLDGIDVGSMEVDAGGDSEQPWDELQKLIGTEDVYSSTKLQPATHIVPDASATTRVAPASGFESSDISVAPSYAEAKNETQQEVSLNGTPEGNTNEPQVRHIAEAAEGELAVLPALGENTVQKNQGVLEVMVGAGEAQRHNKSISTELGEAAADAPAVDGV